MERDNDLYIPRAVYYIIGLIVGYYLAKSMTGYGFASIFHSPEQPPVNIYIINSDTMKDAKGEVL